MDTDPTAKLFVGNLAWATTSEGLRDTFAQYGTVVEAAVISDRQTGRSRGYGFVTMSSPEEAQAAKAALDGQDMDGRPIRLDYARPKADDERGGQVYQMPRNEEAPASDDAMDMAA